jgi:hypothetical protein
MRCEPSIRLTIPVGNHQRPQPTKQEMTNISMISLAIPAHVVSIQPVYCPCRMVTRSILIIKINKVLEPSCVGRCEYELAQLVFEYDHNLVDRRFEC